MSQKLHKTKGIVLRTVKYGETSIVVTVFTDAFGVQSYLVNGIRTSTKGSSKANMFQPAAILDLVVYHNEFRNLQRISEFQWSHLYENIFLDVRKNSVALFMVELLTKCLKQPEANNDLFEFAEDCLLRLDQSSEPVTANFPLFFSLHLAVFFGFRINDEFSERNNFLDLQEGLFVAERPTHPHFLDDQQAAVTSQLLKIMQPEELEQIKLNHDFRRSLLYAYETFYSFHVPNFGSMKTIPVLRELLN